MKLWHSPQDIISIHVVSKHPYEWITNDSTLLHQIQLTQRPFSRVQNRYHLVHHIQSFLFLMTRSIYNSSSANSSTSYFHPWIFRCICRFLLSLGPNTEPSTTRHPFFGLRSSFFNPIPPFLVRLSPVDIKTRVMPVTLFFCNWDSHLRGFAPKLVANSQ